MGISGTAVLWFKNYLSGLSQLVDINGFKSDALSLDISVIQGSILGPILFLCYINDSTLPQLYFQFFLQMILRVLDKEKISKISLVT